MLLLPLGWYLSPTSHHDLLFHHSLDVKLTSEIRVFSQMRVNQGTSVPRNLEESLKDSDFPCILHEGGNVEKAVLPMENRGSLLWTDSLLVGLW